MAAEHERLLRDWRVLVVEDDYDAAMALRRRLTTAGALVMGPVPSVRQASDCIEASGLPDLAVLDIHRGGPERVYPLAGRLAAQNVPFVFMTRELDIHPEFQARPCVAKDLGARGLLAALQVIVATSSPAAHRGLNAGP